jgi:phosphocarrier protein HPr
MSGPSRRQVEIRNSLGFHLRAACRFVQLSRQFQADVHVFCNGRRANGGSVLDLMMLAAGCGARLDLEVTGPDAEPAAAALCALIEDGIQDETEGYV